MSRIVEIERDSRPVNIKVGLTPAEEINCIYQMGYI